MYNKILTLLHTLLHLRPTQVVYRLWYRLHKPKYRQLSAPATASVVPDWTEWIEKGCLGNDGTFCFLNISDSFHGWNHTEHGALWAYNLNYMDRLCQEGMTFGEGAQWIDRFIDDLPANRIGIDPYPIALRGINWVKFICRYAREIEPGRRKRWNDSLYSQYRLLERKLEYHLLGNHLLEDAYSLFVGGIYFRDERMYRKACRLLRHELDEQILEDGAHYEQSPMYHCILLDRLLDCLSFSQHAEGLCGLQEMRTFLAERATKMLGHLESICYEGGSYPLFGDSAQGIAPTPRQLFDYAGRLGLAWKPLKLGACGYRHFRRGDMEAFVDVGNIMATYQPGHSHADTLSFELRIGGKPFIVDTGISTYNKTPRRQYERSTEAHNTVTIEGSGSSSEVWSGFRVGRRAKVTLLKDEENKVIARHDGYAPAVHKRSFIMDDNGCIVTDTVTGTNRQAHCRLHLAAGVKIVDVVESGDVTVVSTSAGKITVCGASDINVVPCEVSREYNRLLAAYCVEMAFSKHLKYTIER